MTTRAALLERALDLVADVAAARVKGAPDDLFDRANALLAEARPDPVKEAVKTIDDYLGGKPGGPSLMPAWSVIRAALATPKSAAAIDEESVRKHVEGEIADTLKGCGTRMQRFDSPHLSYSLSEWVRSGAYRKAPKP